MQVTNFGALSTAQKKLWATEVTVAGRDNNFWMMNGFVGRNTADMTKPIHRITDLTRTERGLTAIMQLVAELQKDGTPGDNIAEDNAEPLENDAIEITCDQLRHAVASKGRVAEQSTVLRFRSLAKDKLGFWLGDTIDELMFLTAAGRAYTLTTGGATRSDPALAQLRFASSVTSASSGRIMHAGSASSEGSLTASDKMNWNLLVQACAYAKRKRLKPIRGGGKPYYAVVMSTEQARDLKQDNTYQTLVSKAGPRGVNNPLFNNAFAVVDGLILYEHPKVYNTLDATSGTAKWGSGMTVDGAQAMLMGAQALGWATIGDTIWAEDTKDGGNRPIIFYGRLFGMLKPQYKSQYDSNTRQDFGLLHIKTAAAQTA